MPSYHYYGTATIGVWAKKNNLWARVTTMALTINEVQSSAGNKTFNYSYENEVLLGTDVQAIGLEWMGVDSNGTGSITGWASTRWQTPGAGTERVATPNGEVTLVTVRP